MLTIALRSWSIRPVADRVILELRKGTRSAVLAIRLHPLGNELRVEVDGSFIWSQVFKPGASPGLGAVADEHRSAFESRGWIAVVGNERPQ